MKKLFLFFLLGGFATAVSAQSAFEAGGFGMIESPWILNSNVTAAGDDQDYEFGFQPAFGINLGFYFSESVGAGFEVISRSLNQGWVGENDLGESYNSSISINSLDIPLFLKLGNKAYFEVGPQIGFLSGHKYEWSDELGNSVNANVDSIWQSTNFSLAFGFGANIDLSDKVWLNFGLRFNYGFTDLEGQDALGRNIKNDAWYTDPDPNDPAVDALYDEYEKNFAVSAGFKLGVMYRLVRE